MLIIKLKIMRASHVVSYVLMTLVTVIATACGDASAKGETGTNITDTNLPEEFAPDAGHPALHRSQTGGLAVAMPDSLAKSIVSRFKMYNFHDTLTGDTLHFNLFSPQPVEPGRIYPLVMFLPDASTVGKSRREPVRRSLGALAWASPDFQRRNPCYVLVPQYRDVAVNGKRQVSNEVGMTVRMLKSVLQNWQIDLSRVYVSGQSMGGMIAMHLTSEYPDLFAASMFVACDWSIESYNKIVNLPFVFIAAQADTKSAESQQALEKALTAKGVRYAASQWNATLSPQMQDTLATQLLKHGEKHFFITLDDIDGDPHYGTFNHAYSLTPVLEWIMKQHTLDF